MNGWPADITPNGFPDATANNLIDPSMFSTNNIQQFHLPQQQQQQQQHRSQTPQFQVNSVVPAKRGRPDDGALESRSQTPQQQGYPTGFQGQQQQGQPFQAPNPYQHLQHGSANATPSPTMSNQQYRPAPQPSQQRLQTVSPNPPFPGQQPQAGMGMSPPPDANGRVNTPQNAQFSMGGQMGGQMAGQMGGMNFMPGTSMPQGYNQNFGGAQNMAAAAAAQQQQQTSYAGSQVQLTPNLAAQQAEMHRMHQLKMQQQQNMMAQNRAAAQHAQQAQAANRNMMMAQQNMGTPTRPQGHPGMNPQAMQARQADEHAFLQKVGRYMAQLQKPFQPQPMVAGRPLSLFFLFNIVLKAKGSQRVSQNGQWPHVANALRFPPEQYPSAAMEIREIFERCLGPWEAATFASMTQQQKAKVDAMQQAQMNNMAGASQMSPNRQMPQTPQANAQQNQQQYMQQLQQQRMQTVQQQQQQQMGQMTPVQANASLPPSNGWSTPQSVPAAATPQAAMENRKSVSVTRQLEGSPAQPKQPTFATPPPSKLPERADSTSKITNGNVVPSAPWQNPTNYQPNTRKLAASWGGLDVDQANNVGEVIGRLKPDVPDVPEMGNLDVHAITRSLQSGIAGEVRYALDYLVKISNEHRIYLDLEMCEDLTDVLIDCAEEQVDILAEEAPEVSDILDLSSYEDVIRNVKTEIHGLQDIPEAGTLAYRLDRAADRLIAITTVLRNLSFSLPGMEKNQHVLSAPSVIKFLSNAIRLMGTRMLFLRSHLNTQDFMKDVVVFLSNVADKVSLPTRDDALSILHFLLSFAPRPCPTTVQPLRFTPYNPAIHPYYPPAIDSLAKLLARDEPNRSFYKHIFLENITVSTETAVYQQYDLLTRAFAFAIAVVPERVSSRAPANQAEFLRLVEARKPQLTQGLLAADILSALCPGVDVGLAKAWLQAEDGWAPSLIRLALLLIRRDVEIHQQRTSRLPAGQQPRHNPKDDDAAFALITPRAFGLIKRLGQRSIDPTSVPSHTKDESEDADPEGEGQASGSDEGFTGGEVKAINLDGPVDDVDEDVEVDRMGVFDGFNGEIVPKSDFLLGVLFLIGIDQGVLREVWEVAEVWEKA